MVETHHRVLNVDDERTITDTLALIFTGNGYDARKAYSAEQAVDFIAEWRPDLAILDVVLPVMNGIDLATLLRLSIQPAECYFSRAPRVPQN